MKAEERLARAFLEAHAPHAAVTLAQMPPARAAAVLSAVPAAVAAPVLHELTVPYAAGCLAQVPTATAAAIISELTSGDAAAIMRALPGEVQAAILAALTEDVREPITRVLPYPDGTAGAVMDPSVFQLAADVLVADARARLRRAAHELLYYIYVVDREHRLIGVLDIPELMLARPRDPVTSAMNRDVDRIPVWTPVALVREHAAWQRFHAMPVVDDEDHLLGAIRYQTLRRLEREAFGRTPDAATLTADAFAELFQLGTTGLVAGIAATASPAETDAPTTPDSEATDAE